MNSSHDVEQAAGPLPDSSSEPDKKTNMNRWVLLLGVIILVILAAILIPVGLLVLKDDDDDELSVALNNERCEDAVTIFVDKDQHTSDSFAEQDSSPMLNSIPSPNNAEWNWFHFTGINGYVNVSVEADAYLTLAVYRSTIDLNDVNPNVTNSERCRSIVNVINNANDQDTRHLYDGISNYGTNDWVMNTQEGIDYYASVARPYSSQSRFFNISVAPAKEEAAELLVTNDKCEDAALVNFSEQEDSNAVQVHNFTSMYAGTTSGDDLEHDICLPTLTMGEAFHPTLWYRFEGTGRPVNVYAYEARPDVLVYKGTDCGSLERVGRICLESSSWPNGAMNQTNSNKLTISTGIGEVYYVRSIVPTRRIPGDPFPEQQAMVFQEENQDILSPSNGDCPSAESMESKQELVNISFAGAEADPSVDEGFCQDKDINSYWHGRWYKFVGNGERAWIRSPPAPTFPDRTPVWKLDSNIMFIETECGGDGTTRVYDSCETRSNDEPVSFLTEAGKTYYVYVAVCPLCDREEGYTFGLIVP